MVPDFLSRLYHQTLQHSATWTIYFMSLSLGILIPTCVYLLRWFSRLKGQKANKTKDVKRNCWFCNEDVILQASDNDSWKCPCCEQYNGFTKDGDYSQPPKEQFDVKHHKTPTVCSPSEFTAAKSVLCEPCNQNQQLKVRQLAAFIPFNEANYSDEVRMYSDYLELRYSLCDRCQKQVSQYLTGQDQQLTSTMTDDNLNQLGRLRKQTTDSRDDLQPVAVAICRKSILPTVLFSFCVASGLVHVISCLKVYRAPYLPSGSVSYVSLPNTSHISLLPDWLAEWGQLMSVWFGTIFCIVGLLSAGKDRLYPEDVVHLILWLMVIVCYLLTASSSQFILLVAVVTVMLSFICCLRTRVPRNVIAVKIHKKQISQPEMSAKESTQNLNSQHANVRPREASQTPVPQQTHSVARRESTPQVENVQQHLEGLSLGLARKSGSTSSIWSLPAGFSASSVTPDSTTEQATQRNQRSILSPSRLGFLNMDSPVTDKHSTTSRSSSPWAPISENVHNEAISSRQDIDEKQNQGHSLQWSLFSDTSDSSPVNASAFRFPVPKKSTSALPDSGPCDSQTPNSTLTHFFNYRLCQNGRVVGHSSDTQIQVSKNIGNSFKIPETTEYRVDKPRRSQRIAMLGKLPKPWPLKKSFSCTNAYDISTIQGLRCLDTVGYKIQRNKENKHSLSDKTNVVQPAMLSPVQELGSNTRVHEAVATSTRDARCRKDRAPLFEFSDDDCDEGDGVNKLKGSTRNKVTIKGHPRYDVFWPWMLMGFIMGASLTTNIFLVCQGWWNHDRH